MKSLSTQGSIGPPQCAIAGLDPQASIRCWIPLEMPLVEGVADAKSETG
jgi:hypothetical protein